VNKIYIIFVLLMFFFYFRYSLFILDTFLIIKLTTNETYRVCLNSMLVFVYFDFICLAPFTYPTMYVLTRKKIYTNNNDP